MRLRWAITLGVIVVGLLMLIVNACVKPSDPRLVSTLDGGGTVLFVVGLFVMWPINYCIDARRERARGERQVNRYPGWQWFLLVPYWIKDENAEVPKWIKYPFLAGALLFLAVIVIAYGKAVLFDY